MPILSAIVVEKLPFSPNSSYLQLINKAAPGSRSQASFCLLESGHQGCQVYDAMKGCAPDATIYKIWDGSVFPASDGYLVARSGLAPVSWAKYMNPSAPPTLWRWACWKKNTASTSNSWSGLSRDSLSRLSRSPLPSF